MSVDALFFDEKFAHEYPKRRGLEELFLDGNRVISEQIPENDAAFQALSEVDFPLFPVETTSTERMHMLPADSRDLTSYIRFARLDTVEDLGQLLGYKLQKVLNISGQLPTEDTVERWALHSDNKSADSLYVGVDIKLLPPFTGFEHGQVNQITELVMDSLVECDYLGEKIERFMEGVECGVHRIG